MMDLNFMSNRKSKAGYSNCVKTTKANLDLSDMTGASSATVVVIVTFAVVGAGAAVLVAAVTCVMMGAGLDSGVTEFALAEAFPELPPMSTIK